MSSKIVQRIKKLKEEMVNVVGSGNIAGTVGEPPVRKKKPKLLRRKTKVFEETSFRGHTAFEVDDEFFHRCREGKKRYDRYVDYVGDDERGNEIRQYGLKNPGKPIIVKHKNTGAMQYLRYGRY